MGALLFVKGKVEKEDTLTQYRYPPLSASHYDTSLSQKTCIISACFCYLKEIQRGFSLLQNRWKAKRVFCVCLAERLMQAPGTCTARAALPGSSPKTTLGSLVSSYQSFTPYVSVLYLDLSCASISNTCPEISEKHGWDYFLGLGMGENFSI